MKFTETDIIAKAWLTIEVVNLVLFKDDQQVDKIFLIGSYASGKADSRSDIDFLIQLKGGKRPGQYYTSWKKIEEIHSKLGTRRIHVIFGTEIAAQRLHERHKNEDKNYTYKEINQGRIINVSNSRRTLLPQ